MYLVLEVMYLVVLEVMDTLLVTPVCQDTMVAKVSDLGININVLLYKILCQIFVYCKQDDHGITMSVLSIVQFSM